MATVIDRHSQPTWRDFLELTKPKVVVLMLITSLIGMLLATKAPLDGFVPWQVLIFGNLGIGLCAGAAAAVNHVVDRRIDSIMARTHKYCWPRAGCRRAWRWASRCSWRWPGWPCCWPSPTR